MVNSLDLSFDQKILSTYQIDLDAINFDLLIIFQQKYDMEIFPVAVNWTKLVVLLFKNFVKYFDEQWFKNGHNGCYEAYTRVYQVQAMLSSQFMQK